MKQKMSVREFADALSNVVREFIEEKEFYKQAVMTIGRDREGALVVEVHEVNNVKHIKDGKEYTVADLYVTDELRQEMPNYEAINKIAEEWCG